MNLGPGLLTTKLPKGFYSSGINCGVRRYRPDLGIIYSEHTATAVGVFTQNQCKAAPVLYCQNVLPNTNIKGIITNSGQANAATGSQGVKDNMQMASAAAQALGCKPEQILTASTGVIGTSLDIDRITKAVPDLVHQATDRAEPFALSILTTDLVPKTVSAEVELGGGTVTITGIAKGSGMIHPNMATMLGYLVTDAVINPTLAQSVLTKAVNKSFNMISVDGECSTNDSVFLMANGATGVEVADNEDLFIFQNALTEIAVTLAKSIARDGEGASKLIEVTITGAPFEDLAKNAAKGLVISPLVKTAIHGEDPNWGRVLARLGAEGVPVDCLDKMMLRLQDISIYESQQYLESNVPEIIKKLRNDTVHIDVDFKSGPYCATAWGCDLTKKYVEINAEYTT